jgi:fibronectin-binding autotransporter adhesin
MDVREGTLVFDGVTVIGSGGIRPDAEMSSSTVARVVVTNGASIILPGNNSLPVGNNSPIPGTNIYDIAGTCIITNGFIRMARNASLYSECNLYAGGDVWLQAVISEGTINPNRFNFHGGTLRAAITTNNFLQVDEAVIWDGGATFHTESNNIDITIPLRGTGGLTKEGSGRLILQGANEFTGNIQVNAGDLTLYSAHAGTGSVTVADGGTLGLNSSGAGQVVYLSAATVGSAVGGTLKCRFGGGQTGNPTMPAGHVTNLTLNGTITVDVTTLDGGTPDSVIPLVGYGTLSGTPTLVTGSLPDGVSGTVVNNTTANQIQLVLTPPAPPELSWSASPGLLELYWPVLGTFVQSNSVSVANTAFWFDIAGTDSMTNLTIIPNPAFTNVFYRLRYP